VSFDHLDMCKKCGKDLSEVRQTLNLPDFEANVPFLLGTLVGEMEGGAGGGSPGGLSLTQETELDFGGLDTSEPSGTEQTVDIGDMGDTLDIGATEDLELSELALDDMDTEPTVPLDDEVSELSLDDLAGGVDEAATGDDEDEGFMGLELEMDEGLSDDFGSPEETLAVEDTAGPGDLEEGADDDAALELDLSDDDLSDFAQTFEGTLSTEIESEEALELEDVIMEMEEEIKE
jgi:hypothetical protein